MTKIGLIAPFEGLYRRSGYGALDAMRAALVNADIDPGVAGVIPLALDDMADPERARRSAEKMMVGPTKTKIMGAVIGPLSPAMSAGARDALSDAPLWIAPYAVDPAGGFADPATATDWADELVAAIAEAVRSQGQSRLVLAGWTPGWPEHTADEWSGIAGMTVLLLDDERNDIGALQPDDALLWLGDAAGGARYLAGLRAGQPTLPFWLGPEGGDPVFAERTEGALNEVYWAIWSPVEYNAGHAPGLLDAPVDQLVYLATRDALDRMAGASSAGMPSPEEPAWQVRFFSLTANGVSAPISFD